MLGELHALCTAHAQVSRCGTETPIAPFGLGVASALSLRLLGQLMTARNHVLGTGPVWFLGGRYALWGMPDGALSARSCKQQEFCSFIPLLKRTSPHDLGAMRALSFLAMVALSPGSFQP